MISSHSNSSVPEKTDMVIILPRPKPQDRQEFMKRYPRVTSHILAHSLGYETPTTAAKVGLDGLHGRENWSERIYSCYGRSARKCLEDSIKYRHNHKGYMAEYKFAKALVDRYLETGKEPMFMSWP